MPDGAVYVGRPGIFGNPWDLENYGDRSIVLFRRWLDGRMSQREMSEKWLHLTHSLPYARQRLLSNLNTLRGKDLACWCKEGTPCHADILLELANQ